MHQLAIRRDRLLDTLSISLLYSILITHVPGYPQGPTGEAGLTDAFWFHRLPNRSNRLSCFEPPEQADFDIAFRRLWNISITDQQRRLDTGLGK